MSRPRLGAAPMSSAERQARRRARLRQQRPASPAAPTRRLAPRPARWAAAVATLARLQEEYRDWLDNLPPNLESSALADKLQTIVDLDLEVAGGRPTTRLWSRLMSPLTTKAPYKPAPAKAGVRAVLAALDMTAQRPHGTSPWAEGPRSAALDRRHDLELAEAHMAGMRGTPSRPAVAEDVRHLDRWP